MRESHVDRWCSGYLGVVRWWCIALVVLGCEGSIADPRYQPKDPDTPIVCEDADAIILGSAPVRRLTNVEYLNTLRDLFGSLPELPDMPVDGVASGVFENDARSLGPSDLRIARYEAAAMAMGAHAVTDADARAHMVPCDTEDGACIDAFVRHAGRKIFRRPLTDDQVTRFTTFFETQRSAIDFDAAIQLTLAAMLQSPYFLYRLEHGAGGGEQVALDSHELASRLSYFLWESAPDDELLDAADADAIDLEAQARRMLDDPRARATVRNFHRQWLHLDRVVGEWKIADFPLWSDEVAAAAREESQRFAEHAVFGGGGLEALFTSNVAFIDESLAPIYEVDAPTEPFGEVPLDPETRAGILTRIAFLGGHAHEAVGSPPLRGVFVMERLLCEPRPSPPGDADTSPPMQRFGEGPFTNRQLFEQRTEPGVCLGCHRRIDGFGYGFENYDTTGAYRTIDNTLPVDATGYAQGIGNDAEYDGAVELQRLLVESDVVQRCVAEKWLTYAQGRAVEQEDACHLDALERAFDESGHDIEQLLIDIVLRPEFALRPAIGGDE